MFAVNTVLSDRKNSENCLLNIGVVRRESYRRRLG